MPVEGTIYACHASEAQTIYPIVGVPSPPRAGQLLPNQVSHVRALSASSLRILQTHRQELAIAAAQYHVKVAPDVPVNQLLGQVLATLRCVLVAFPIACGRLRISSCEGFFHVKISSE